MVSEFPFEPLSNYVTVQGGFAFKSDDFKSTGVPVLKIKNIRQRDVDVSEVAYVDPSVAKTAGRYFCTHGDLLISMTGSGPQAPSSLVGRVARFCGPDNTYLLNQRVGRFYIREPSKLDGRFLFYVLNLSEYQQTLVSRATGSANQANISNRQIEALEIPIPIIEEQRAISYILGTLDDKIELNRRMNETLEAIARALFKSWFIDFDPVRAKAAGRDPKLPKHLADLFPDSFEDSELGELPKGWDVASVADIGNVICGKTPSTRQPEYYGDDVPFITIPDMHGKIFAMKTGKQLSRAGAESQGNKMLPPGAICVSCIATPGLVVITSEPAQTNQQINSVIPNNSEERLFWYWILRELADEIRASGSGGSVLSNLSTGRFADLRILAPLSEIRSAYHLQVAPLFDRILATERETITLAALRDTLLPKLISGEIRIKATHRSPHEQSKVPAGI